MNLASVEMSSETAIKRVLKSIMEHNIFYK